jgi:CarboxypepD_reg-like domain/Secretion system C-terminal sorting domain
MRKIYILLMMVFEATHAYSFATLEGRIYDKETNEPLIFTPIGMYSLDKKLVSVAESDIDGNYIFTNLQGGNYYLRAVYIGYSECENDFSIKEGENLKINIEMVESSIILEEVVICCMHSRLIENYSTCCGTQIICSFADCLIADSDDITTNTFYSDQISFNLFPNPAANKLFIRSGKTINEVSVLSMRGEVLISLFPKINYVEIDITALPNGIYLLQVDEDGKKVIKKITKFE